MITAKNVCAIFALQGMAVLLNQLSLTTKKFADAFIAQSSLLNMASLMTTVIMSAILFFSLIWITNRTSSRFASTIMLIALTIILLILTTFILPYWKYSPAHLVAWSKKLDSYSDYFIFLVASAPFVKTHALLGIYGVFSLSFVFWQTANSISSRRDAYAFYPLLTITFGGLHFGAQWIIKKGLGLLIPSMAHHSVLLPMACCTAMLVPVLLVFLASMHILPPGVQKNQLTQGALSIVRACICDRHLRAYTLTNTMGMLSIGLVTAYVMDMNVLVYHEMLFSPQHWPTYNCAFVWSMLLICATIAYVVLNLYTPVMLIRIFAGALLALGCGVAMLLPNKNVHISLSLLYGILAIKGCKHALFTVPKQIIYMGWSAEYRLKIKAFVDLCVDRLALLLGGVAYVIMRAVQVEYGCPFYPTIGLSITILAAVMLWQSRFLHALVNPKD